MHSARVYIMIQNYAYYCCGQLLFVLVDHCIVSPSGYSATLTDIICEGGPPVWVFQWTDERHLARNRVSGPSNWIVPKAQLGHNCVSEIGNVLPKCSVYTIPHCSPLLPGYFELWAEVLITTSSASPSAYCLASKVYTTSSRNSAL